MRLPFLRKKSVPDEQPIWAWGPEEQLANYGMRFQHFGDAVPGGYNGTIGAYHPETGEYMGHIDYRTEDHADRGDIADIQVDPAHRRKGVATTLLNYMRQYMPDTAFEHGFTTPEGEAWRTSLPNDLQGQMAPWDGQRQANILDPVHKTMRLPFLRKKSVPEYDPTAYLAQPDFFEQAKRHGFDPAVLHDIRRWAWGEAGEGTGCMFQANAVNQEYPHAEYRSGYVDGQNHAWNELPDGTIFDMTYGQILPLGHPEHQSYEPYTDELARKYGDLPQHRANVLDPVHNELDARVWDRPADPDPTLKTVHAHWLTKTITDILHRHGYDGMEKWMTLVLTGSLTTYQYSEESDCDISLFVDSVNFPEWSRSEMIGIMISECDGVKLPGTPHELQIYVVSKALTPQDLYKPGLRAGYDIRKATWIVPPDKSMSHDVEHEMNEAYTIALQNADKMQSLLRYEPRKAVMFWHQIHSRRMRDQKAGKGDYAPSNITYKALSNRGLLPEIAEVSGEYIAGIHQEAKVAMTPEEPPPITVVQKPRWHEGEQAGYRMPEMGRQPFVYHSPSRTVYLGEEGSHHGDLAGDIPDEHLDDQRFMHEGEIGLNVPGMPVFHYDSPYRGMPDSDALLSALREATGLDLRRQQEWMRSSAQNYDPPAGLSEDDAQWARDWVPGMRNVPYLYHVAPSSARESIAKEGLRVTPALHEGQVPGVFCEPNLETAESYWGSRVEGDHDIWRIPQSEVRDLAYDPAGQALIIPHSVRAELHQPAGGLVQSFVDEPHEDDRPSEEVTQREDHDEHLAHDSTEDTPSEPHGDEVEAEHDIEDDKESRHSVEPQPELPEQDEEHEEHEEEETEDERKDRGAHAASIADPIA